MCLLNCICRSTNSVSLRSPSPLVGSKHQLLPKQSNPVLSSQTSHLTVPVASNESTSANSVNTKPTKRKSLGDAVTPQGNFTQSFNKHDLRQVYHAINQLDYFVQTENISNEEHACYVF